MSLQPVIQLPVLPINGITPAYASATTLTVSTGQAWVQDLNGVYLYQVSVPSTLTIDGTVNGALGLDTGTLAASTLYYVHLIADAAGYNTPSAIISLSRTAPTLPQGAVSGQSYNIFKHVGFIYTDGSTHFLPFWTSGTKAARTYWWDSKVSVLSGGTSTTFAAVNLTSQLAVPPIDNTPVLLQANYTPSLASHVAQFRPTGSTATTGAQSISGAVAAVAQDEQVEVLSKLATGAASIDYIVTATDALSLSVLAFDFTL